MTPEPAQHAEDVRNMVGRWCKCYGCSAYGVNHPLRYRRADGVWGLSYPLCLTCRKNERRRLGSLGFTNIHVPTHIDG